MMNDYVGLLKKMSEMTIGHTENVTRVTEGLANGGVAITTDKDGNQGIFTPVSRKGSLKSLEIFRRMAEENGLKVEVAVPAWNKDEEAVEINMAKENEKNDSKTSVNNEIDPSNCAPTYTACGIEGKQKALIHH